MTEKTICQFPPFEVGRRFLRAMAVAPIAVVVAATFAVAQSDQFERAWPNTDFSRLAVDLNEVISGGPPRDGILANLDPTLIRASEETWLDDREPVMTYVPETGPARAYLIRYLMWHEIVNDLVDGRPIAVTFCPLCNTGMMFDGRLDGRTLTFGVSGLLRHSDMIMYDHESESWWSRTAQVSALDT